MTSIAKRIKKQMSLQILAFSGLIWMIIFCFIPMTFVMIAFTDYNILKPFWQSPWVGLKHFRNFFTSRDFPMILENTFGIGMLKLIFCFPMPIAFALMLNEMKHNTGKRIAQTITYLPHFISWVIIGGIIISFLSDTGPINALLMTLGVHKEPVYYLAEPDYFWGIVTISEIWKETGWQAIIYIAAIAGIQPELYESATIDGANRLNKIIHITIPGIMPTIVVLFILAAGKLMESNFNQIMVLTNQLNYMRSTTLDIHIFKSGIQRYKHSYATAIGLCNTAVSLILVILSNAIAKKLTGTGIMGEDNVK